MRVVLDTNVIVSALVWGGIPYRLLQLAEAGEITLVTSPTLIAELADVLGRTHLATRIAAQDMSAMALVAQYAAFAESVSPESVPAVIADDPDDDHVLACAVSGGVDMIVSGDKHLLRLGGKYDNIVIVNASEAINIILG